MQNYKVQVEIEAKGAKSATENLSGLDKALNGLGGAGELIGSLASPLGLVTAGASAFTVGFTAAAASAYQLGATVFELARQTAEYGSKIKDASDKTGLSATTLSALKLAADQSGSSLDQVATSITKFSKLVGDAADGSKEAAAKLKEFGVEPQKAMADLDGSLEKVFKRIADAKPGVEQTKLAFDAFGKSGADLIPVIKSFDGDIDGLIKRAKELGIVFDDDAANAADEFGDSLDDLQAAAKSLGIVIGNEVMPDITYALKRLTSHITQNRETFSDWVSTGIYGIKLWANVQIASIEAVYAPLRVLLGLYEDIANQDFTMSASKAAAAESAKRFSVLPGNVGMGGGGARVLSTDDGDGNRRSGGTGGGGSRRPARIVDPRRAALERAAEILGVNPVDLATIISYETGGTLSPFAKNNQGYKGLIQFSPENFKRYGVGNYNTFESQLLGPVVKYFQDRTSKVGGTKGMSITELYKTVIGGGPNVSLDASDANGSIRNHLAKMLRDNRPAVLKSIFGGSAGGTTQADLTKTQFDEQKRLREEASQDEKDVLRRSFEQFKANNENLMLEEERRYEAGAISAREYSERIGQLRLAAIEREIAGLQLVADSELSTADEREEALHRLSLLDAQVTAQRLSNSIDSIKAIRKEADLADEIFEKAKSQAFELLTAAEKINERLRQMGEEGRKNLKQLSIDAGGTGMFGQIMDGLDEATGQVRTWGDVMTQVGSMVTSTFLQMGQAVGNMIGQWVLMGDQADLSMAKMVAGVLAGVAAQAATLAIFHVAMGIAALTPWGSAMYGPAPLHFKAAALWGGIAVGAALAGRAIAGNSAQNGTPASDANSQPDYYTANPSGSLRSGTIPAQQTGIAKQVEGLTAAVDGLNRKISGMRPGDVLTAGAKERRGFLTETVTSELNQNPTQVGKLGRAMNLR